MCIIMCKNRSPLTRKNVMRWPRTVWHWVMVDENHLELELLPHNGRTLQHEEPECPASADCSQGQVFGLVVKLLVESPAFHL